MARPGADDDELRIEERQKRITLPTESTNPDTPYTTLDVNLFTAVGHRYHEAGFFEPDAPIVKQLDINASAR